MPRVPVPTAINQTCRDRIEAMHQPAFTPVHLIFTTHLMQVSNASRSSCLSFSLQPRRTATPTTAHLQLPDPVLGVLIPASTTAHTFLRVVSQINASSCHPFMSVYACTSSPKAEETGSCRAVLYIAHSASSQSWRPECRKQSVC